MQKRLALISTVVDVANAMTQLVHEFEPGVETFNFVDDSILRTISRNGNEVPAHVVRHVAGYCRFAEEAGADAVLITCSSISEMADRVRPFVSIPVYKIDEPMAEQAVAIASAKIGVLATVQTTLRPTARLIESKTEGSGKCISVTSLVAAGAFEALQEGRREAHDDIVLAAMQSLLERCDVVVLAQASMARAAERLSPDEANRVLTSPKLGVGAALAQLARLA